MLTAALMLTACVIPVAAGTRLASRCTAAGNGRLITTFQIFHTTFVRNFNPFSAAALDYTAGAIYEPLYIITTAGGGHSYPWLATAYRWQNGGKTLLITIRHGVRWSDGQPFTAQDVLFTFTYGGQVGIADQINYTPRNTSNIASVKLVGSDQVEVNFKAVDITVLPRLLSNIKIIPRHVWSSIKNPATFTNPDPVGTGPFTHVASFASQQYVLTKNPYYWQAGKRMADGLRVPLYTGNDSANLALAAGQFDWESTFVPNLQHVYVAADPAHRHYSIDEIQGANGLYFNDETYPFSLVAFRKAISYAVDRVKLWKIGEYGYEPPADAIGIAAVWPSWVDKSLTAASTDLSTYNPAKAKAVLAKAGFTWKGSQLIDPKGHPVAMELSVPSGWTDYVLDCQIMERELRAIGINATVKLMDLASWTDKQNRGYFSAVLQAPPNGPTPYYYFNSYMSKQSYAPTGQDASLKGFNLERWWTPQANDLLLRYQQSTDPATQHQIIDQLQRIQLDQLPWIPLFNSPYIYTYSTLHFTGWPSKSNDYALGPTWQYPDCVKVMTTVEPVM